MVLFSVIFDCGKPRKLPHKLPNRGVIDAMMKRVVIKMTDRSFWILECILDYLWIHISVISTWILNQLIQVVLRDTSVTNN